MRTLASLSTRLLIVASLLLATFSHTQAQQQLMREVYDTKTDTWVQVTCLFGKLPPQGYVPIRVEINNGTDTDRTCDIDFTSKDDYSYGYETGSQLKSSFQFSCAAGENETYDIVVPLTTIFQTSYYSVSSSLDMDLRFSGFSLVESSISSDFSSDWPAVIASKAIYIPNASAIDGKISSSSRGGSYAFAGSFEPKKMPTDWRAYMGQEIIMLTSDDWTDLDPGAKTAILDWNCLGGKLLIYSSKSADSFKSLQITGEPSSKTKKSIQRGMGSVSIQPYNASSGMLNTDATYKLLGKGNTDNPVSPTTHGGILKNFANNWPLQKVMGDKHFNITFFIILLILFGILIGPINLFVFAKAGKRHKLFITTPIISLSASALLLVLILFQDGFGGKGHRVSIMEIFPKENKAYIFQEQIARTGVLLGSSFETSEPTSMTPVALKSSRWARVVTDSNSSASYLANDGETGLSASGDWFQSRSIHGHLLKTVRPTRGRIDLSPQAGAPVLSSTFDYDLETVYYQAKNKSWWRADSLPKGGSATLSPVDEAEFQQWIDTQAKLFSSGHAKKVHNFTTQPGRFYTLTENAPATETYEAIKWQSTKTLITGKIGG